MILICPASSSPFSSSASSPLFPLLCCIFPAKALQQAAPTGDDGQPVPSGSGGASAPPLPWLTVNTVQLTVPLGDDCQLVPGGSDGPSGNAVELIVHIGDDGQLMSGVFGGPSRSMA